MYSISRARDATAVEEVVVTTDDLEIAEIARAHGAEVVLRPDELADDNASSESALIHALDARGGANHVEPELVVFLQPTSPARRAGDIDAAVELIRRDGADSVVSGCRDHAFYWRIGNDGPEPANYDLAHRPRGQDAPPQFRENGSIYVVRTEILRRTGLRAGGRIRIYEMDLWSSFELDSEADAELLEWILARPEFRVGH